MTDTRTVFVPDGLAGERVDVGLARLLGFSRARVADLVDADAVTIDGQPVVKSARLTPGQVVHVQLPEPIAGPVVVPEMIDDLRIVFDDDDIVVVSKPVGVAAHPSPGWSGPTVVGGLAGAGYRIATSGAPERQGIVQRLDVGTSGLMVVTKSETAYSVMKQAFRQRAVDKVYHTIVQGHPDPAHGTIDAPIGRHPKGDGRMAVMAAGKPSITHYQTVEAFRHASYLEVQLETGRTHQIRVHMAAVKHPCVGDPQYGGDPKLAEKLGLNRQWLHAVRLGFTHPTSGEYVQFADDLPADLIAAVEVLREMSGH